MLTPEMLTQLGISGGFFILCLQMLKGQSAAISAERAAQSEVLRGMVEGWREEVRTWRAENSAREERIHAFMCELLQCVTANVAQVNRVESKVDSMRALAERLRVCPNAKPGDEGRAP